MIVALIPAAGKSERMGRPKLTLPIHGTPLIVRVVRAFFRGGAERVVVVVPPDSVPGASLLESEARSAGAEVVVAERPPPDMRASVELGLARLNLGLPPSVLLLAPGDSPGLSPELVAQVIARAKAEPQAIVRPTVQGRGGHPIALPWTLANEIPQLPPDVGVNALVRAHSDNVIVLELDDPGATADIDTPEDYARWSEGRGE